MSIRRRTKARSTRLSGFNCASRTLLRFTTTVGRSHLKREVAWLRRFHRPVICTEYMARPAGSTFDTILPIARQERRRRHQLGIRGRQDADVFALGVGKHPYILSQPPVWFHEVLHPDGTPYRQAEVDLIRQLTGEEVGSLR